MKFKFLFIFFLNSFLVEAQSLPTISLKSINGSDIVLSGNSNKKILIVTVPLEKNDLYDQLVIFCNKYGNKIQVYGVPSIELGNNNIDIEGLKNIYLNINITLTEPIFTHKKSGSQQNELFQWLTDKDKNRHFDVDVSGFGQKYFLSESKRLFAVLAPNSSFSLPIIEKIVNASAN